VLASIPTRADNPAARVDVHLHLPTRTVVKVFVAALLAWAVFRLWPEFVFIFISILLAVALHPAITALERKGLSRGLVVAGFSALLLAVTVLLLTLVSTSLAEQITKLAQDFPTLRARVDQQIPAEYPTLKRVLTEIFALPSSPEVAAQLKRPLALGKVALSGGVTVFFTLIATIYLLLDGKRVYAWLIAYIPRVHRERMAITSEEVSKVVYAYVRGQALISVMFALFAAAVLHLFRVPAAVPLAVLAGLCDVIPVVGVILATVPATLLALTVSPTTAVAVLGLYVGYHVVESYFIVPRVYGTRLRLSTLAVILALLAGVTLQGLIGAVLVLPLVAAYPIIERIWLAEYLAPEVVRDHSALAKTVDSDHHEQVVDAVLQGDRLPGEGLTGRFTR
jgi:predicted PurR-regulated permease PerM